jgi:glycosyltransferase involved in cell wall biosynthesis
MKALRILHVINSLCVGGAEMTLARLVERLQAAGHSNVILALTEPDTLAPRLEAAGATIERLGLKLGRPPSPAALWRMRAAFRRHQPDIVQGWMYHGNLGASVGGWAATSAAPVIWNIRSSLTNHHLKPMTRWVIRLGGHLGRLPAAVIYCSAASAPQHERIGFPPAKRVVIPNGIDCEVYRPRASARAAVNALCGLPSEMPAEKMPIIGSVARYDPVKGHAVLIEAFGRLVAAGRPAHLMLIGPGLDKGNDIVAGLIREAGIGPHVTLAGERHDVSELLPGFDVACLPSLGEAWPNFLGEAMASGVPCVATDVGQVRDILGDLGLVVEAGNVDGLAAALARMLDKPPEERRAIGLASRRRVEDNFSFAAMVSSYESLYKLTTSVNCHRKSSRWWNA